jgi:fermentation-respiration switch protein FrsA (DUF1100 family)
MEYPGYSIYVGEPNADQILRDAEIVYDFLYLEAGIPQENIMLFGRSIGSGPATHLAAKKDPSALILMSAYTSIRAVVRDYFGKIAQYLIAERFNNLEHIENVKCPVLLLHGASDKLITKEHAVSLFRACKKTSCKLKLSETMTHNEYDIDDDIIGPILDFFKDHNIKIEEDIFYEFPEEFYDKPECLRGKKNTRPLISKLFDKLIEMNDV